MADPYRKPELVETHYQYSFESTVLDLSYEKSNDLRIQTDLMPTIVHTDGTNVGSHMIRKSVGIQTEPITIIQNNQQISGRQYTANRDIMNKKQPSPTSKGSVLNMSQEETLDLTQWMTPVKEAGTVTDALLTKNRRIVDTHADELTQRIRYTIKSVTLNFNPIVGYAQEPLLPLFKACALLADLIYNLSFYVQMALNETPEVPPDGLTIDESAAIRLYTMEWEEPHRSLYSMLNSALKKDDRRYLRPYFKYLKLFLTALTKLPCLPPQTVWRGVTKDLSAEFLPDTSVTWWAFSSCTNELTVLENNMYLGTIGNRTLFSVEAINGRAIRAHSHFLAEDETLLLPGTQMIVQSQFCPAPDLHIIHLKQVVPKEILLEPPFEGILNILNHSFYIISISLLRCKTLFEKSVSLTSSLLNCVFHDMFFRPF